MDDDCRENMRCVPDSYGGLRCMASCTEGTRLCPDGGVCQLAPSGEMLCWFGGDTPHDFECETDLLCEAGTLCSGGICTQACNDGDDSTCKQDLETCADDGFCEPLPQPPPDAG